MFGEGTPEQSRRPMYVAIALVAVVMAGVLAYFLWSNRFSDFEGATSGKKFSGEGTVLDANSLLVGSKTDWSGNETRYVCEVDVPLPSPGTTVAFEGLVGGGYRTQSPHYLPDGTTSTETITIRIVLKNCRVGSGG